MEGRFDERPGGQMACRRTWASGRRGSRVALGLAWALSCLTLAATPALAIDFFDGRIQVHGSFEEDVRILGRELSYHDGIDLAQWYHVLNLEIETDLAPQGIGPLDLFTAFARIEVRYDCVWTRACGLAPSANLYGDRPQRTPRRLWDAREEGRIGTLEDGDRRPVIGQSLDDLALAFRDQPLQFEQRTGPIWNTNFNVLFTTPGADNTAGTADDPAFYLFQQFIEGDYRFNARSVPAPAPGGVNGQFLGPWLPKNQIEPIGVLSDRANPFRGPVDALGGVRSDGGDRHPIFRYPAGSPLAGQPIVGGTERPYRRAPEFGFQDSSAPAFDARGVYYPSPALADLVRDDRLGSFDQNYSQNELAWNYGAGQDEQELKELYFDLGLFDSRLWVRAGKQTIVWGKTELLRSTDQFNPQDFGLASLPTLEESRLALWSLRAIWSFDDVGPFDDVRVEAAANLDDFEPADLGRCGEPFAANPVCAKSFGLFAHGITGVGLAGERRPPDPWDESQGFEVGARIEFRWDRFTFQISDFWGYDDLPYPERVFTYERNVDPTSGRPRKPADQGQCLTGREPACLTPEESLASHHANQGLFASVCASTVGIISLDPTVCGQSLLNSRNALEGFPGVTITNAVSSILSLNPLPALSKGVYAGVSGVIPGTTPGYPDLTGNGVVDLSDIPLVTLSTTGGEMGGVGLDAVLSQQQEALLGCGPLYATTGCTEFGIDLLNAEASALIQSFPGFEGTFGASWSTLDGSVAQPGTLGFVGGPVCTRNVRGSLVILPGCRGPGMPGYDPLVDGVPPNPALNGVGGNLTTQPFTGQAWSSEMAALSWNFLQLLVAFSGIGQDAAVRAQRLDFFDPTNPFAANKCSFETPYLCFNVSEFLKLIGAERATVRAGGSSRFGRRDFGWHQGGEVVLRYDKRNVLGLATDFVDDWSKSTWNLEATWIPNAPFQDADAYDGISRGDVWNLTISMDRPTFINFLNPNRTFFFNTQWFMQVADGHGKGWTQNGPVNVAATFTAQTGYYQDRLLPSVTAVYDFRSESGGLLPQVAWRFTENFSATVGMNVFWGRWQAKPAPINDPAISVNRVGDHKDQQWVENGLAVIRERDEVWMRLRYTF